MFNLKWGIIAGAAAFVLSLLVGSLNHVAFLSLLIRALIFAVVFFALGVGSNILINTHLSELLVSESANGEIADTLSTPASPGSRINITLGDSGGALPEMYRQSGGEEVGNFSDLMSGAIGPALAGGLAGGLTGDSIDQTPQSGYTTGGITGSDAPNRDNPAPALETDSAESGGSGTFRPAPAFSGPVFTAAVSEGDDLGGLPDLDAMAGAFLGGDDEGPAGESPAAPMPGRPGRGSGAKKPGSGDDFNPKELAEGIRTILAKEKQG